MNEKRTKDLSENLAAYPFSLLQDFLTFQKHCQRVGIDIDEVAAYVNHFVGEAPRAQARKRRAIEQTLEQKAPRCTVCGQVLSLENINDHEARMIDDHSKSWWVCPDPMCGFEPLVRDKYPHEIYIELGVTVHQKTKEAFINMKRKRSAAARGCKKARRR